VYVGLFFFDGHLEELMSQVTLLAEFEVKQQHLDGLLAAAQREMSRIHADEPGCPRFDVTMLSDGDRRSVLVETCKLNGVDPQAYFTDLLTRLVNGWPQARIDELMPWNYHGQTTH
jgi:hypothetical protein